MTSAFPRSARADGPPPTAAGKNGSVRTLHWLLGSRYQAILRGRPRTPPHREWHFGWALEGRAVQMSGSCRARANCVTAMRPRRSIPMARRCGSMIRHRRWRIQWNRSGGEEFPADDRRANGDDIVQSGTRPDGQLMR